MCLRLVSAGVAYSWSRATDASCSDGVSRADFQEVTSRGGVWVDHIPTLYTLSATAWQKELDKRQMEEEGERTA